MREMKTWHIDDFELEFGISLAEDCEAATSDAEYYTLADGRKVEVVKTSSVVKLNGQVVGRIEDD